LIVAMAATVGGAESTSFIAVAGGVNSGGHAGPPSADRPTSRNARG
jgi:hypothetical protein